MPTYEYECTECEHRMTARQGMTDPLQPGPSLLRPLDSLRSQALRAINPFADALCQLRPESRGESLAAFPHGICRFRRRAVDRG